MRRTGFLAGVIAFLSALFATAPASAAVRELQPSALKSLLAAEPANVFLLDVRTPPEFAGGRLPGSKLIPMNDVPKRLAEIPKNKKVVVICASGARSAAVAKYLDEQGYPWVGNLASGVMGWMRQGLPTER